MTYYVSTSMDIKGNFGSGATKQSVISSLKKNGISDPNKFEDLALALSRDKKKVVLDSAHTLLLGSDKDSREEIGEDLIYYFGDNAEEIALKVPKLKEWLACVTLIDNDKKPTFQVIALVGSSALEKAKISWTKEDKPPQIWKTHSWYDLPPDKDGYKPVGFQMVREVKAFTGMANW